MTKIIKEWYFQLKVEDVKNKYLFPKTINILLDFLLLPS